MCNVDEVMLYIYFAWLPSVKTSARPGIGLIYLEIFFGNVKSEQILILGWNMNHWVKTIFSNISIIKQATKSVNHFAAPNT